jgi:hypothetical protein
MSRTRGSAGLTRLAECNLFSVFRLRLTDKYVQQGLTLEEAMA